MSQIKEFNNQVGQTANTRSQVKPPTSTFASNMKLPVHGWFRFSAGFSAQWVGDTIKRQTGVDDLVMLDPFVGVGTSVIAAEEMGVTSYGLEAQPFVARIAQAKLHWNTDVSKPTKVSWISKRSFSARVTCHSIDPRSSCTSGILHLAGKTGFPISWLLEST